MAALALLQGIVHLNLAILDTVHRLELDPMAASGTLMTVKDNVNQCMAMPLAHTLKLAGGYFSDLSSKRWKKIAEGFRDQQLGKWLEAKPPHAFFLMM